MLYCSLVFKLSTVYLITSSVLSINAVWIHFDQTFLFQVSVLMMVVVVVGLMGGSWAQQGRGSTLLEDLEQELLDQGWAPPPPRFHYRGFNRPGRKVNLV